MSKFKIFTTDKFTKKVVKRTNTKTIRNGKIDIDDLMQSSFTAELYMINDKGFELLRKAKKVAVTFKTTTIIYVKPIDY